jgi:hypothetical protein
VRKSNRRSSELGAFQRFVGFPLDQESWVANRHLRLLLGGMCFSEVFDLKPTKGTGVSEYWGVGVLVDRKPTSVLYSGS